MKKIVTANLFFYLLLLLTACTSTKHSDSSGVVINTSIPGISGMAALSENEYLIVQDAKAHKPNKPRLGLLTVDGRVKYTPMNFPQGAFAPSSDLEGVCRVPNTANEFLLSESGYWKTHYGRIFHIRISEKQVTILRHIQLPFIRDNGPDQQDGDQFEGIACAARSDSEVLILLGERGGTSVYPTGILRWGKYSPDTGQVVWSKKSQPVSAPNPWGTNSLRSITGLSIDHDGQLWASAAVDSGKDLGPFRSLVYLIGVIDVDAEIPVTLSAQAPTAQWITDGFKIEAVSAGTGLWPLSIGTEDETLNGAWRPLPK